MKNFVPPKEVMEKALTGAENNTYSKSLQTEGYLEKLEFSFKIEA